MKTHPVCYFLIPRELSKRQCPSSCSVQILEHDGQLEEPSPCRKQGSSWVHVPAAAPKSLKHSFGILTTLHIVRLLPQCLIEGIPYFLDPA